MTKIAALTLCILFASVAAEAQGRSWTIQLEEPTGIERRDKEAVRTVTRFAAGLARAGQLRVLDDEGRELPVQVVIGDTHPDGSIKSAEILFPATLIPGRLPRYRLFVLPLAPSLTAPGKYGGDYLTDIIVRRLGTSRLELGNNRFGIIINLGKDNTEPAIIEAYNRTSGEHRMLNLVETTPDEKEELSFGVKSAGWGTQLAGGAARAAEFTEVNVIEAGPLRARVRLRGARHAAGAEEWEFEWYANSPVIVWRARTETANDKYGFFFSAISATPYEPFTHWAGGAEVGWPDGWETDNPPHKKIIPQTFLVRAQDFDDLPGGHILYYNPQANYGALAFIELDSALKWFGVGSRQFYAVRESGTRKPQAAQEGIAAIKRPEVIERQTEWTSQIAIAFPEWRGTETLLEARACYRRFAQPILAHTFAPEPLARLPAYTPAPRTAVYHVEQGAEKEKVAGGVIELSLDGAWKLRQAEKGDGEKQGLFSAATDDSAWQTVQVPGSVHTQILKYPAYYTHEAEWISFKEWWYRKSFRVPAEMKGKRIRLQFDATDYYADIWLNGQKLGRHEGYIDPFEFEVTDGLSTTGENVIAVRVWTPVDYYWRHRPYTIKGSYGAVDQKPDNITALGITRSVRLVANHSVVIEEVTSRPSLNRDGSADVDVEVALGADQVAGRLEISLAPRNFLGGEQLKAIVDLSSLIDNNERRFQVRLHLNKPQLWWTWDHGRPNLYTLSTRVLVDGQVSDERRQSVGIREIEKVGWVFYLNGRRLYIRGTNSYYLELFMSEMNRQKYERDINLMKSMNVNMIRLHCHFQNPEFYDLTDELGILVWQDFLEAWYPRDTEFALRAAQLYDKHIQMVRNHPSLAIWATSDEEDLENYRVLTKHLAGRLYAGDQERRAVIRSTGRFGDGHIYYGWYGGNIWEYAKTEEKFISELGATALPDYETLMQFLPNHWPIEDHKEEWVFRKLQIMEAMRAWGRPDGLTLKEYIPRTQAYVARLHQLAIEQMRRRKYAAGGILHFHAIDFWPSVTMAALDYFRKPTKSYFTVQRSFQMVLASLEYDRDTWRAGEDFRCGLWVINDHWYQIPGARVRWKIVKSNGAAATGGEFVVNIAEDSSAKIADLRWRAAGAGAYELRAEVFDRDGKRLSENLYEFEVK